MDATTVMTLLQIIIQNLPGAITTAEQLYALGVKFAATIKGTALTDAERTALRAQITDDVLAAMLALPPAQPGDPDYVAPGA